MTEVPRVFAAKTTGLIQVLSLAEYYTLTGISPAASAAYDILTDDGMAPDKAWELALACQKSGRDPEALAWHTVKLRRSLRTTRPRP